MQVFLQFFDIHSTYFKIFSYSVSYIEFTGSVAGIIAVWLAAKSKILTWPVGLINIILFFLIFWQVELYSDVFLQVYYFCISIYGWHNWKKEKELNAPIKLLKTSSKFLLMGTIFIATVFLGFAVSNLHVMIPNVFQKPASFPYIDSFLAISSIIANTLMAQRFIENWILWIIVNVISVVVYFLKDIIFVSMEYFVFLILAIYGFYYWKKEFALISK